MAFPRKLLAPAEEVVLEAHPNWSILVPRTLLFFVVVAGCLAVAVAWRSAPLWTGYVLLGVGAVFLLALLAKVAVWRSTTLVITNRRVVYRTGLLHRLGREIPLDRVQDVTYGQSLLERMVRAGSLTIESAGSGGREPFPDIRHPALVQSLINRLITAPSPGYSQDPRYGQPQPYGQPQTYGQPQYPQAGHAPAPPAPPASGPAPSPAPPAPRPAPEGPSGAPEYPASPSEQLRRLDELLRLGVITDAEYVAKRRELLQGR